MLGNGWPNSVGGSWIVVVDGPGAVEFQKWPPGAVVVRNPVHGGVSTARNRALALAGDGWVLSLDADDVPDAEGMAAFVRDPLVGDEAVGWISANRSFLDGSPSVHHRATPRRWVRHELSPAWTLPTYPFNVSSVLARTEVALAAGGWPAVIVCENVGWVLAKSEHAGGASSTHTVTRYRTWQGQTTHSTWFDDEFVTAYTAVTRMTNARRAIMGQPPVTFPSPPATGVGDSAYHRQQARPRM
ncbi:glycosyltransferase family 2 protein [Streptomyces piniterrae]|uniref:Glycosyltransferase family 2 protein n=1 Tax=Streptomyces piniterrae TaxID=2571125 RepID=A0A4U0P8U0_9ACTN|nr:glycosyltransferase family A protein [Streptomyces piniterrae]TJZ59144.1 glycosyltransferase family 2 protein [Streptomyces piniterrae]